MLDRFFSKLKHNEKKVDISQLELGEVDEIDDQETLREIAEKHENRSIRDFAFSKLTDEKILFDMANNSDDENLRLRAFHAIEDEDLIFTFAKTSDDENIRMSALYDLTKGESLVDLSENAKYEDVRNAAKSLLDVEKTDTSRLTCKDFAKAFKMAVFRNNVSKGNEILSAWKFKCEGDGNFGFALAAALAFDESEDHKTIFHNMNDIFHDASQRRCADESLRSWYVHFAFTFIDGYRKKWILKE